jgi:hypothetical protein
METVLGMTLKGAAIAGPAWQLISILTRFFNFVSKSEGEVSVLMLYLHGLTFLMCVSMVLGKRLRFFKKIEHQKVKCQYKRPAFRDHFHKSFAFKFQTNLPMSYGRTSGCLNLEMSVDEINVCLTDHANQNLSKAQKELLRLHYWFGHVKYAANSSRDTRRAARHYARAQGNAYCGIKM